MIEYKIKNKLTPLSSELLGYVEELYSKVIYKRMTSDFAREIILPEAEAPFFEKSDDKNPPVGFWRGEFWGKWMISAVRAAKYKKRPELEKIIRESIYRIIASADADGYIGSYANPKLILPASPEDAKRAVGFECDFCWNIWCQKYTLWGLIEAYELLSDERILAAAKRLAAQLISTVHELSVHPCETGTFFGVASGSICKPMLLLYRHTGDEKLLNFALDIADGFENEKTECIKIIKKTLDGAPPHTWNYDNPRAIGEKKYTSQKAYEMMSCFEGILELYRLTGAEKYFDVTRRFFDLLIEHEYNNVLSVGFTDRFLEAARIQDSSSEVCDIIHFMRLAAELFLLTGDERYMNYFEAAFLNPFLASITRDGTWCAFAVRSSSYHVKDSNVIGMKYNHCCVNNMPRAFESAASLIATKGDEAIFINNYLESNIQTGDTRLEISDGYTDGCKVSITCKTAHGQTLMLRIPSWSKRTLIKYGGKEYRATGGYYLPLALAEGEGVIEIEFDSTPRFTYGAYGSESFDLLPFLKKQYDHSAPAYRTSFNKATLRIGPILLAQSAELGATPDDMFGDFTVRGKSFECEATCLAREDSLARYELRLKVDGGEKTLHMQDFATASNRFMPEDFTIFI